MDLSDLAAARNEALRIAPAYRVAISDAGEDPNDCAIEVSDQNRRLVSVTLL